MKIVCMHLGNAIVWEWLQNTQMSVYHCMFKFFCMIFSVAFHSILFVILWLVLDFLFSFFFFHSFCSQFSAPCGTQVCDHLIDNRSIVVSVIDASINKTSSTKYLYEMKGREREKEREKKPSNNNSYNRSSNPRTNKHTSTINGKIDL